MIDSTVRHRAAPDRSFETTGWWREIAKSVIQTNVKRHSDSALILSQSKFVNHLFKIAYNCQLTDSSCEQISFNN